MNALTRETPLQIIEEAVPESQSVAEGSKLYTTYFEFRATFPAVVEVGPVEMSDEELLIAAEKAGTFDFLNAPEEDGYNDLLPKRE